MRRILLASLLIIGALLFTSRLVAAEEPVAAWMTGYVVNAYGTAISGAQVCAKQGTTTCVSTDAKGFWQITGLTTGEVERVVICITQSEPKQPVESLVLTPNNNNSGVLHTSCIYISTVGPCDGVFPPELSAPCPHNWPPPCPFPSCFGIPAPAPTPICTSFHGICRSVPPSVITSHRPVPMPVSLPQTGGGAEATSFWEPIPARGWLYVTFAAVVMMLIGVYIGRQSR